MCKMPITTNDSLAFKLNDISIWNGGTGVAVGGEMLSILNFDVPTISVPSTSLGGFGTVQGSIDYFKGGLFGSLGMSAGVFDLNYDVASSLELPSIVKTGDTFTINTAITKITNPYIDIDGPSINAKLELRSDFKAGVEISPSWIFGNDKIGININSGFKWDILDLSYLNKKMEGKTTLKASTEDLFKMDSSSIFSRLTGDDKSKAFGLLNYLDVGTNWLLKNTIPVSYNMDIDLNALDKKQIYVYSDNKIANFDVTATPQNPYFSFYVDIDDLIPVLKPADWKGKASGKDYEIGAFSVDAMIGVSPYLKATTNIENIEARLLSSTGELKVGNLGDSFIFTAPKSATTPFKIDAEYYLDGDIKFEYGLQVEGGFEIKLGELRYGDFEANVLKTDLKYQHPFSFGDSSVSLNSLQKIKNSYTINLSETATTDTVYGITPPILPRYSLDIINATYNLNEYYIDEGTTQNQTATFRISRTKNTDVAQTVSYNFNFSEELNADDFVNGLPQSGSVSFAAGDSYKDIVINIKADPEAELNEKITMTINTKDAEMSSSIKTLTIKSDDGLKINANGYTIGSNGKDYITGSSNNDEIIAQIGNDTINISGKSGHDTVDGGTGIDTLNLDWSNNDKRGAVAFSIQKIDGSWVHFGSYGYPYVYGGIYGATDLSTKATIDNIQSALASSSKTFKYTTNAYDKDSSSVSWSNIETLNIVGSEYSDFMAYQSGSKSYKGLGGDDTFYGDFSSWEEAIVWNNTANSTNTTFSNESEIKLGASHQVSVSGFEELLLITGSGNDEITQNVEASTNEFRLGAGNDKLTIITPQAAKYSGYYNTIDMGSGNDTVNSGSSRDSINAGTGNDTINISGNSEHDTVDGGAGTDTLNIDWSNNKFGKGLVVAFSIQKADGNWVHFGTHGYSGSSWLGGYSVSDSTKATIDNIQSAFASSPKSFKYSFGSYGEESSVSWNNIESLNVIGAQYADFMLYQAGGKSYKGLGGHDTFYGDFSSWEEAVVWNNTTSSYYSDEKEVKLGAEHQVAVSGFERLLLVTGSGNDEITQGVMDSYEADEFRLGAGATPLS